MCGRSKCTGTAVAVTVRGYTYRTRLDSTGHAVVLVAGRPSRGVLTAAVAVTGQPRLGMRSVAISVR
jgi:hypothetical protein